MAGSERRIAVAILTALLAACTVYVPRHAFRTALENQKHINALRMGQTLTEVERVMQKGPERRNARVRFDGVSIEEWSYATDPVRKLDTVITFVGGKVFEINTAPWGGEEKEEAKPCEPVSSPAARPNPR